MAKLKSYTLTVIGSEQAGKTCFLAGLGILGESDRNNGFRISTSGESTQLLNELARSLRSQQWPAGTTASRDFVGVVCYKGVDLNLELLDFSGERFREHFAQGLPADTRIVESLMRSDFVLIALDPTVDLAGEALRKGEVGDVQAYLERLESLTQALDRRRVEYGDLPCVAVLITKADSVSENLSDPRKAAIYLKMVAPSLHAHLISSFGVNRVFAVSAVGSTTTSTVGQRIPGRDLAPWGYESILDWILKDIAGKRRESTMRRTMKWLVPALVISMGGVFFYEANQIQKSAELEKYGKTKALPQDSSKIGELARQASEDTRQKSVDSAIESTQELLKKSESEKSAIESQIIKNDSLISEIPYKRGELVNLTVELKNRIKDNMLESLRELAKVASPEFDNAAKDYAENYPNDPEVSELREQVERTRTEADVKIVQGLSTGSLRELLAKANKIDELLKKHPGIEDATMIGRAVSRAKELYQHVISENVVELELRRIGHFAEASNLKLEIYCDGSPVYSDIAVGTMEYAFTKPDSKHAILPWTPEREVFLRLYRDTARVYKSWAGYKWTLVAEKSIGKGIPALAKLNGRIELDPIADGGLFFSEGPYLECTVKLFDGEESAIGQSDSAQDGDSWGLLESWIDPGLEWIK